MSSSPPIHGSPHSSTSSRRRASTALLSRPKPKVVYKTLQEVKTEGYKYTEITEQSDGIKFVNGEMCIRQSDVLLTESGDWQLQPNRSERGLTKGSTRDCNRYGKDDQFQPGDKVLVPSPTLNQLCDGGLIRPEGPKKIGDDLCYRIDWIPTREGSNKNLLDYTPAWIKSDNILLYQSTNKAPPEPSSESRRDASKWTFESMTSLQLNREVVSDESGKNLYVMVCKSKKDNAIWGRPVSSTGVPDGTRFDLELVPFSSLGPKGCCFDDAKSGFEQYRANEERAARTLITEQKERARALAKKELTLAEAAATARRQQTLNAAQSSDATPESEKQVEDEKEQKPPETSDGKDEVIIEHPEDEKDNTQDGGAEPLEADFLDQYVGGGDDNSVFSDLTGEESGTNTQSELVTDPLQILQQFGVPDELIDEDGMPALLHQFAGMRRQCASLEKVVKSWGECFANCQEALKHNTEQRSAAHSEFGRVARSLHAEVEEVRAMGAGFGAIMKTMTNILSKNCDSSDSLKLLVSQMAKELSVRVVQPSQLPDAFGEDLWVQMDNFIRFFGPGGTYRIMRGEDVPTLQKVSPTKTIVIHSPAKTVSGGIHATGLVSQSQPAAASLSTQHHPAAKIAMLKKPTLASAAPVDDDDLTPLSSSPAEKEPPSTPSRAFVKDQTQEVKRAGLATLKRKVPQPTFVARPQNASGSTSASAGNSPSVQKVRPTGPWGTINFVQDSFFAGPEFTNFLKKVIKRFGGRKLSHSQLGPLCFIYWSYPEWDPATAAAADLQNRFKLGASKMTPWQKDLVERKYKCSSAASSSSPSHPRTQQLQSRSVSATTSPRASPAPPQEASGSSQVTSSRGGGGNRGGGRGGPRGGPRGGGRGRGGGARTQQPPTLNPKTRSKNKALTGECLNPFEDSQIDSSRFYEDGWGTMYSDDDVDHVVDMCNKRLAAKTVFTWAINALNHLLQCLVYRSLVDDIQCWLDLNLSLHACRSALTPAPNAQMLTFDEEVAVCKTYPWVWAAIKQFFARSSRSIESLKECGDAVLHLLVDRMVKNSFVWVSRPPKGRSIVPKVQQTAVNAAIWKRQESRKLQLEVSQEQLAFEEGIEEHDDLNADVIDEDDEADSDRQVASPGLPIDEDDEIDSILSGTLPLSPADPMLASVLDPEENKELEAAEDGGDDKVSDLLEPKEKYAKLGDDFVVSEGGE